MVLFSKEEKSVHKMAVRVGLVPKVEDLARERVGVRGFGSWGQWHLSVIIYGAIGSMAQCKLMGRRVFVG